MVKVLLVVLDGASDRPCRALGGKTPLEVAVKPGIDAIARKGAEGMIDIIDAKTPPQTDTALIALFGNDPKKVSCGRGPLEAVGVGLAPRAGELILRGNFATVSKGKITDTRAGRISSGNARKLVSALNRIKLSGASIRVKSSLDYRFLLFIHSKRELSARISNTHPGYVRDKHLIEYPVTVRPMEPIQKCRPLENSAAAKFTAKLINEFVEKSAKVLAKHKLCAKLDPEPNFVLMRGAGTRLPKLINLPERYGGRWVCVGDTPAERGVAKLAGMKIISIGEPEVDKLLKTPDDIDKAIRHDMKERVPLALRALNKYDFVYVHLKGADPFGHSNKPLLKVSVIEAIDKYFFRPVLSQISPMDVAIVITCDHTTACEAHAHVPDPVPVVMGGIGIVPDGRRSFDEKSCAQGALGLIKSEKFMATLFTKLNAR